jgi:signal transduction histidine kinase
LSKWVEDFIFENLLRQEVHRVDKAAISLQSPDKRGAIVAQSDIAEFPSDWQPWLSGLSDGLHELDSDISLMALVTRDNSGRRFYIVAQTDELEYIDSNLSTVIAFTLLVLMLTFLGGVVLSLFLVRRIIRPIEHFTRWVAETDPISGELPAPPTFGNNEIGSLARAFNSLQQRLAAYIRRERRFTSDVSHELRTPLAVSSNALELFEERELSDQDKRILMRLKRSNRRMQSLIETFLALAREENLANGSVSRMPLQSLIDEAIEYHKSAYPRYEPQVVRNHDPDYCIRGSPILLSILIRNLLVNGILYSPDQRVEIAAQASIVRICNRTGANGEKDHKTGVGLSIAERVCEALGFELKLRRTIDSFEAIIDCRS